MKVCKKEIDCIIKKKKNNFNKINFSFEVFFSSKINFEKNFLFFINKLSMLNTNFISIVHSSNDRNTKNMYNFINIIKNYTNIELAPYMTCINFKNKELKKISIKYKKKKIKHIIALCGDSIYKNTKFHFNAINLIVLLKEISNFYISVLAYPEVHPEAKSSQYDLINLKNKLDSGADQAITQFFFDIENFLRFRDRCSGIGIKKKIIPGILPIQDFNQVYKFCLISNIYVPKWLKNLYLRSNNLYQKNDLIGFKIAVNMIKELYKEGIRDFHIYTLNKLDFSYSICNSINLD
ncbi:5,10-methylenetetrahydrofolate reductase [Buchnera aphidicola (Periphyllus testudinaceus)]|uniref:methylenetetrahydrofolate reductase n=1 Tax=Buchnera aphidicola TaxID=9 RepID=UPI003464414A